MRGGSSQPHQQGKQCHGSKPILGVTCPLLIPNQNFPNVKNHQPSCSHQTQKIIPKKGPHKTSQKQTGRWGGAHFFRAPCWPAPLWPESLSIQYEPASRWLWSRENQACSPQGVCPSNLQFRQIHKRQQREQPIVSTFPQQFHFQYPTQLPHSILGLEKVAPPSW